MLRTNESDQEGERSTTVLTRRAPHSTTACNHAATARGQKGELKGRCKRFRSQTIDRGLWPGNETTPAQAWLLLVNL